MKSLSQKEQIRRTFSTIRTFSFKEKIHFINITEETINEFLDNILKVKQYLSEKTEKVNKINAKLEKLSWLNSPDQDCLMLLNDLISAAKDLRTTLLRYYTGLNELHKYNIAKEEIEEFKTSIDDLAEISEDLESVFFHLPKMPDFQETTRHISLI